MTELTPRREATVGRLVDAAIQEFASKGIDGTSVEQLCEAAGFSRGAFYSNFQSKDDLCMAVIEQYRDTILSSLAKAVAIVPQGSDVDWMVGTAIRSAFNAFLPRQEMRVTLLEIRLRALRNPELDERLTKLHEETRPLLSSFIDDLTAKTNVALALDTGQIIKIFEALCFYDPQPSDEEAMHELLLSVAISLIRPLGEDSQKSRVSSSSLGLKTI